MQRKPKPIKMVYPGRKWKRVPGSKSNHTVRVTWLWVSERGEAMRRDAVGRCRPARMWTDNNGYLSLKIDGCNRFLHHLVLEAFYMPRPPGMEGRHLDGEPSNNNITNLDWSDHATNMADKAIHGTISHGVEHGNAILDESTVMAIRKDGASGQYTQQSLAAKYNVSRGCICNIIYGNTWSHLPLLPFNNKRTAQNTNGKKAWIKADEIKAKYATGKYTQTELANQYDTSQSTISSILKS